MSSTINLPRVVAIWRHSNDIHRNGSCNAALFRCKQIHPSQWHFSFIHKPLRYIENADLVQSNEDEWFGATLHVINIINNGNNYTRIRYNGWVIISNVGKPNIPVVKIENKSAVLPPEFSNLDSRSHKSLRFIMKPGLLYYTPPEMEIHETNDTTIKTYYSLPEKTKYRIPSHIVKEYLQSMIYKKEFCPIERIEFTQENICMTSCGHVMTHDSLTSWMKTSQTCPICRGHLNNSQIYTWTFT